MFDPSKFQTPKPTYILGNSAHPIAKHVKGLTLKKAPDHISQDLYYMRSVNDNFVITYRPSDETIAIWEGTFTSFKTAIESGEVNSEVVTVDSSDKYLGNAVMRELQILKLI